LEGPMESKIQVAAYAATLTRELYRMCRKAGLNDLAYLLEVAAAEASKDRVVRPVTNGVTQGAVHQPSAYTA
jgi:hypothetical protein